MKNRVTQEMFTVVKSFIEAGATYSDVKKFYGLAADTVARMKVSPTYEDYKKRCLADSQKKLAKEKAKKATVVTAETTKPSVNTPTPVTTPVVSPLFQQDVRELLREQNAHLKLISDKLAYIVQQLS